MGYDRGDSFPFDFKPNIVSFGSKSAGKLSPRSYPIQFERKWKNSFLRVFLSMSRMPINNVNTHAKLLYNQLNLPLPPPTS